MGEPLERPPKEKQPLPVPMIAQKPYVIEPLSLGTIPGLNYDDTAELIALGEGEDWR